MNHEKRMIKTELPAIRARAVLGKTICCWCACGESTWRQTHSYVMSRKAKVATN